MIDEKRLREELRDAPVPSDGGGEQRAWETVASAYTELRRESAQRALRSSAPEPSTTTSVRRSGPPLAAREMAVGKRVSWNMG